MQRWIFSHRTRNRWSLASVGTCRKNRIRRVRATTRRKGCVLEKARLSPTTHRVRDTRERRRDLPLRGYPARQGRRTSTPVSVSERRTEREEWIWLPDDERGETSARVCVYGSVGIRVATTNARECHGRERERKRGRRIGERCRKGARCKEGESERQGEERERERKRERERERGSTLPPPRGVKTTPRARGVSGLGAETNRARPKRAQCPTHTRSRTAHD